MRLSLATLTLFLLFLFSGTAFSGKSNIELLDEHVDTRTVKNGIGTNTSAVTLTLVYCVGKDAFLSQQRPGTQSDIVLIPLNMSCEEYKSQ